MNCPRCTQEIPQGGRFCPACGLDLHSVSGEFSAQDLLGGEGEAPADVAASEAGASSPGADTSIPNGASAAAGPGAAGTSGASARPGAGPNAEGGRADGGSDDGADAGFGRSFESGNDSWPSWLALRSAGSPKKPMLAGTLAFFFGPFAYLYLEQAAWFWAGFLGGILLCVIGWPYMLFLLQLGFMLHCWDVARILNERLQEMNPELIPEELIEEEGV